MIELRDITLSYEDSAVMSNFSLTVEEGQLMLLAGPTGSGKSSLLGILNGLVPEFTGGNLSGSIQIAHHDRSQTNSAHWSTLVATVTQSPLDSFVADIVEDEIAFGMETHGFSPDAMRQRVEEVRSEEHTSELQSH